MLCDHISSILMAVARKIAGGLSNSMETPLRAQFLASSGQSRSGHMAPDQITAKFFIEHKSLRVQENPLQICHNCEHFQMQTIQTEMQRGSVSQAKKYWIWGSIVEIPLLIYKKNTNTSYFDIWWKECHLFLIRPMLKLCDSPGSTGSTGSTSSPGFSLSGFFSRFLQGNNKQVGNLGQQMPRSLLTPISHDARLGVTVFSMDMLSRAAKQRRILLEFRQVA